MKKVLFKASLLAMCLCLNSCTYSINLIHTEGTATDMIDEVSTPTANISPNLNIPVKAI